MFGLRKTTALFMLVLAMSSGLADAQSLDTSKLTAEERTALQTVLDKMVEDKSDAATVLEAIRTIDVNSEQFATWAQAGTEAGKAVSNFTKEIGATANEFLDSFPGKAIFLIVFMNYGGGALASFFLDIAIFVCLTPFFIYFMNRVFRRFVLHQSYDVTKPKGERWFKLPGRGADGTKVEKVFTDDKGNGGIEVDVFEAILGWFFTVIGTMLYLSQLWPTWPVQ